MKPLISALFALLLTAALFAQTKEITIDESSSFEGKVEYTIQNDGTAWNYTLWKKGSLWRTEMRLGTQLIELRIGDLENNSAYLVNETGKTYTSISRQRGDGPPNGKRPSDNNPPKRKPIELEKFVISHETSPTTLGYETNSHTLKGKGPKLDITSATDLGPFSGHAFPRFKTTEEKTPYLIAYFSEHATTPLIIKQTGKKGPKAFSMTATSIEITPIDDTLLTIPSHFKMQMRRGPQGRGPNNGGKRKGGSGGGGRGQGGGGRGPQ